MNFSDVWDWTFMWQMSRNFVATANPFVMMIVAVSIAGMILGTIVGLFWKKK